MKQAISILSYVHNTAGEGLHYSCDESVSTGLAILCP